mmetsp:Transcript_56778/g.124736  ORF Transcript_56778/g.124736 Transcript_56778/m.124736 type:complete len:285 (-) Transcript_56778:21-875(-)
MRMQPQRLISNLGNRLLTRLLDDAAQAILRFLPVSALQKLCRLAGQREGEHQGLRLVAFDDGGSLRPLHGKDFRKCILEGLGALEEIFRVDRRCASASFAHTARPQIRGEYRRTWKLPVAAQEVHSHDRAISLTPHEAEAHSQGAVIFQSISEDGMRDLAPFGHEDRALVAPPMGRLLLQGVGVLGNGRLQGYAPKFQAVLWGHKQELQLRIKVTARGRHNDTRPSATVYQFQHDEVPTREVELLGNMQIHGASVALRVKALLGAEVREAGLHEDVVCQLLAVH